MRPRPAHWSLIPLVAAGLIACNGGATAATTAWPMYHFDQGRSGNDTGEPSFSNLGNA